MASKTSKKAVFEEALALPKSQRAKLARELLDSLDGQGGEQMTESEWIEELDRRSLALRSGQAKGEPWKAVRARVLSNLKQRRTRAG